MLNVFIADDSVVIRGKLKEALEEQGTIKVVGESGDTEQAIAAVRKIDPQVIIIDIRMPGGGGLPLLKDIKSRNTGQIAIILTSFPYPQYREIYMTAGADFFFDKTQDIPKLSKTLFEIADRDGGTYAG